jgi:hypothetical protein
MQEFLDRAINEEKKVNIKEGKFQKGLWIVLSGRGGELDRAFVKNNRGIKAVLMDWSSTLGHGDVIRIEKGESEGGPAQQGPTHFDKKF